MCIFRGQVGVREVEWVQVLDYVCMTRCCCWGRSDICPVKGWVGDCGGGVESIFFLLD